MSTPLPSLTPMSEGALKDNGRAFADSYNWMVQQFERKKKGIAEYEKRENANLKYVSQEKAFLSAMAKHLGELNARIQYFHDLQNMQLAKEGRDNQLIESLFALLRMHGITQVLETDIVFAKEREQILKEAGAVKVPNALRQTIFGK